MRLYANWFLALWNEGMPDVCFTPESGHSERGRKESAYDPKRTLTGVRRRYVWRSIFKIDEAQFMIAAGRIALYASHL